MTILKKIATTICSVKKMKMALLVLRLLYQRMQKHTTNQMKKKSE